MAISDQQRIQQLEQGLAALQGRVNDLIGRLARGGHNRNPRLVKTVADPETGDYPGGGQSPGSNGLYWIKFLDCTYDESVGLDCEERQETAVFQARPLSCEYYPEDTVVMAYHDNGRWWLARGMQLEYAIWTGTGVEFRPNMETTDPPIELSYDAHPSLLWLLPGFEELHPGTRLVLALIGCHWIILAAACDPSPEELSL